MYSIKPGRGPSFMGGAFSIGAAVFGIFWTVMAVSLSKDHEPTIVRIIFPLFGVMFILIALGGAVYNFFNATAKERLSTYDITSPGKEPDPLNDRFGEKSREAGSDVGLSVEARLAKIEGLRRNGLITEAEFAEQRRRILSQI